QDGILQRLTLHVRYYAVTNLPKLTIKDTLYDCLTSKYAALLLVAEFPILVHVLNPAANKRLVGFHFAPRTAAYFAAPKFMFPECFPDTLKHEPRSLMRDDQGTMQFPTADAVIRL